MVGLECCFAVICRQAFENSYSLINNPKEKNTSKRDKVVEIMEIKESYPN